MRIHIHSNGGSRILAIGLLCLALAGCLPDDLQESGGKDAKEEARSYGLGFTISTDVLTKASGSAGMTYGNEIENYIDPRRLRVLFLDRNGNFQFEFSQYKCDDPLVESGQREKSRLKSGLHLEPLRLSHGDAVTQWFARIPIDQLTDEELKLITDEGFKIAIMANWPDDTFNVTDERDVKTNFLIEGSEQNIANRLAHCYYDPFYNETGTDSDTTNIHNSYLPFLGKDKSGKITQASVTSSWLKTYFKNGRDDGFQDAEEYIRKNYHFDGPENDPYSRSYVVGGSGRKYYNMWYIWNFGGERNAQYDDYYDTRSNVGIRNAWIARNENVGWAKYLGEKVEGQQMTTGNYDGLIFASKGSQEYKLIHDNNHGYGVQMPRIGTPDQHSNGVDFFDFIPNTFDSNTTGKFGYFKIPLAADGKVRLKVGKIGDVSIGVHICEASQFNEQPVNYKDRRLEPFSFDSNKDYQEFEFEAKINERPMYAFLYALSNSDQSRLVIYEIEYIKAEHLYDVDRDGVMPDKENPIPMYGIQDFDPIGEYWTPGELFNLSAFNGLHPERKYNYKWISLLRSVAKVELKIAKAPFNGKKPQYVYMRSMNQTARLNPMDVLTPTDQIWYGDAEHNIAGIEQETSNIQAYGPMFQGRYAKIADEVGFFWNRLAWFYGIWTHPIVGISSSYDADAAKGKKWDWNSNTARGVGDKYIAISYDNSIPSPRVFNPHINRSDYTHFYYDYAREDATYWYYTLYMPEKHMSDANKASDLTSKPKCLHIEMRWEGRNDDSNLDDNASYRIYFAKTDLGGTAVGIYDRDDYENVTAENTKDKPYQGAYEYDLDNLKTFYPIVRNHVYEITVEGINQGDVGLNVRRAAEREPNFSFE